MSRWNEDNWDESRWAVLSIEDMLQQPPTPGRGHLIGVGDWRYAVEIALPAEPSSIWGVGTWDAAEWNRLEWHDLTPYCRGESWTRGADEPYGRPRIGELDIELASPGDIWSPYNASRPCAYFGPGTIVRIGVHSPTHPLRWLPQITTVVDSWTFATRGGGADRPIAVHGWETLRTISQIDDNALSSVEGLGEDAAERIARLLNAAGWQYGLRVDAENLRIPADIAAGFWQLQSTDMAENRIAECYLSADSSDVEFRTDRTGAALVAARHYFGSDGGADPNVWPLVALSNDFNGRVPALGFDHYEHRETINTPDVPDDYEADFLYAPYDVDSFQMVNIDQDIINEARYARQGGTQQVYEQPASIARFGRRTAVRNDLLNRYDTTVAYLARARTARQALNSVRIDNLDVSTSDRGDDVYLSMLAADIGCETYVYPPDGLLFGGGRVGRVYGNIRNFTHRVTPRNEGGVTWSTSLAIDTRIVQGLPAAQLPENPTPAF